MVTVVKSHFRKTRKGKARVKRHIRKKPKTYIVTTKEVREIVYEVPAKTRLQAKKKVRNFEVDVKQVDVEADYIDEITDVVPEEEYY